MPSTPADREIADEVAARYADLLRVVLTMVPVETSQDCMADEP